MAKGSPGHLTRGLRQLPDAIVRLLYVLKAFCDFSWDFLYVASRN